MVWVICLDLSGYMKVLSNARYRAARAAKKNLHYREEKEKGILFSQDSRGEQEIKNKIEKRNRKLKFLSPVSR